MGLSGILGSPGIVMVRREIGIGLSCWVFVDKMSVVLKIIGCVVIFNRVIGRGLCAAKWGVVVGGGVVVLNKCHGFQQLLCFDTISCG